MNLFKASPRLGATPVPETPYQRAGQAWDARLGAARVQAANWRLATMGLIMVALVQDAGIIWLKSQGGVVPWVVEVDRLGQVLVVGRAARGFRPDDRMIAGILERYVEDARGLSSDPVVVEKAWLRAYGATSANAAAMLSDHFNQLKPLIGREQIAVEMLTTRRASPDSFNLIWIERHYAEGRQTRQERWSATLTIALRAPDSAESLKANPIGLVIRGVLWSRELGA
jgi:type IV secretion system protein VirB5